MSRYPLFVGSVAFSYALCLDVGARVFEKYHKRENSPASGDGRTIICLHRYTSCGIYQAVTECAEIQQQILFRMSLHWGAPSHVIQREREKYLFQKEYIRHQNENVLTWFGFFGRQICVFCSQIYCIFIFVTACDSHPTGISLSTPISFHTAMLEPCFRSLAILLRWWLSLQISALWFIRKKNFYCCPNNCMLNNNNLNKFATQQYCHCEWRRF